MLKARPLYFKKENNENEKLKYNSLSVQSLISIALSQLSVHVNLGKFSLLHFSLCSKYPKNNGKDEILESKCNAVCFNSFVTTIFPG